MANIRQLKDKNDEVFYPQTHTKAVVDSNGNTVNDLLDNKQEKLTFDTTPTANSTNPVTSAGIKAYVDNATPDITMDNTPTSGSSNPVKSSGIYNALQGKQNTLTFDSTPTASSTNPVTSGGVKGALDVKADKSDTYTKAQVDAAIAAIDVSSQISGKADKVANAVTGDFAGLDASGNLVDSGKKASDFATAEDVEPIEDKAYSIESFSGLGRINLQLNVVDGKNILAQSMINAPNVCYVVQYDYDLCGETINIPSNCILSFNGGSINNGSIVGDNTLIIAKGRCIGCGLSGTFNNDYFCPEWFIADDDADAIERASAAGVVHLSVGSLYKVSRQIEIKNSIFGTRASGDLRPGGTYDMSKCANVCYTGSGGNSEVDAGEEGRDSIFLIRNTNGIEISNICFFCADGLIISYDDLARMYDENDSFPWGFVYLENPNFSGVKFTTDNGVGFRYNTISNCRFINLPIAINLYDIGKGESYDTTDINTDNNRLRDCSFSGCGIGINIENTNAYNLVIEKPSFYGGSKTYRHINLVKGTFACIEGYFGILGTTSEPIKACIYVGENGGNYKLFAPYAENHRGYFVYSDAERTSSVVDEIYGLHILQRSSDAPTMTFGSNTYNVNIYVSGTGNRLAIFGGTFTNTAIADNSARILMFGLLNVSARYANGGEVLFSGVERNSYGGLFGSGALASASESNESSSIRIGTGANTPIMITNRGGNYLDFTKPGIGSMTLDFSSKTISGALSYYYTPKSYTNGSLPSATRYTICTFKRTPSSGMDDLSVGIVDGNGIIKDVWGNKAGTTYSGTTRPTSVRVGTIFFDESIGMPLWWNGTNWVDSTGSIK